MTAQGRDLNKFSRKNYTHFIVGETEELFFIVNDSTRELI